MSAESQLVDSIAISTIQRMDAVHIFKMVFCLAFKVRAEGRECTRPMKLFHSVVWSFPSDHHVVNVTLSQSG